MTCKQPLKLDGGEDGGEDLTSKVVSSRTQLDCFPVCEGEELHGEVGRHSWTALLSVCVRV